jgi:hypothetical protein
MIISGIGRLRFRPWRGRLVHSYGIRREAWSAL